MTAPIVSVVQPVASPRGWVAAAGAPLVGFAKTASAASGPPRTASSGGRREVRRSASSAAHAGTDDPTGGWDELRRLVEAAERLDADAVVNGLARQLANDLRTLRLGWERGTAAPSAETRDALRELETALDAGDLATIAALASTARRLLDAGGGATRSRRFWNAPPARTEP